MSTTRLLVRRDRLADTRLDILDDAPLADGQIRVRVDAFALTANNITYAAFGDAMNYWQFYPTGEEGWGLIPVWGFGDVVQSLHPGVAVGERLYGYWPMASSAVLQPTKLSASGMTDGAAHRAGLPGVYNQYVRVACDPFHTPDTEDLQALLRPLYTTSWLIDDFMADNAFFGANVMLLSSASSKTAWGTALQLAQRPGIEVIGLTSPANVAYCESLGCYGRVLTYDQLDTVDADSACVYIDFAGNAALRAAIHGRFAQLRYSCSIGGTHVDQLGGGKGLPGPRPVQFFAPAQISKRVGEWGGAAFGQRMVEAWRSFLARVSNPASPWLVTEHHRGADAAQAAYGLVLGGKGDPRTGHILSLRPA